MRSVLLLVFAATLFLIFAYSHEIKALSSWLDVVNNYGVFAIYALIVSLVCIYIDNKLSYKNTVIRFTKDFGNYKKSLSVDFEISKNALCFGLLVSAKDRNRKATSLLIVWGFALSFFLGFIEDVGGVKFIVMGAIVSCFGLLGLFVALYWISSLFGFNIPMITTYYLTIGAYVFMAMRYNHWLIRGLLDKGWCVVEEDSKLFKAIAEKQNIYI